MPKQIFYKGCVYQPLEKSIDKDQSSEYNTNLKEADHDPHRGTGSVPTSRSTRRRLLRNRSNAATRASQPDRNPAATGKATKAQHSAVARLQARLAQKPRRKTVQLHRIASDFKDKYGFDKWVDISASDLQNDPELLNELFQLIKTAYGNDPHKKYLQPVDLLRGDLTIHAINLDDDPAPDALISWKDKPSGDKLDATGHDGGRNARDRMLQEFHRLLGSPGYFVEVSGAPAAVVLKRWPDVKVVDDPEVAQAVLPGKSIVWHGEHPEKLLPGKGWYTRDIGGSPATKILVGLPRA